MIGYIFKNIPRRVVVRCRECGGPAVMEEPFAAVYGRGVREVWADPHVRSIRVGGGLVVERFPDALRWREARGRTFNLVGGSLGVVSCPKCVNRYSHTLDWPADAFYRVEHRGKVLWAWNREYLVMVRDFIASAARNTAGSYYLRRKIPKFFLLAKHRERIVAKIDAVLASA